MQPLAQAAMDMKRSTLADKEVVARVVGGEKALYEVLMRRHNQTLYRAVRSYLRSKEDVEDAMQEAYLKAYAKLEQYKGEAAFSTRANASKVLGYTGDSHYPTPPSVAWT